MATQVPHSPFRSRVVRPLAAGLAGAVLALQLAGCAVQPNGRGGVLIGVDSAEIFGTQIASFPLQNGQQGVLRHDPNTRRFSVKLGGTMRVLPLPNVLTAQLAFTAQVEQRTVAVIETQERNCPYQYVVLAIQGSDILQWNVGNCRERASIAVAEGGQAVHVEFPSGRSLQRYVYADQRLLRTEVALAPPLAPSVPPAAAPQDSAPATAAARVLPQAPRKADPPAVAERGTPARPARPARRVQQAQLPASMTMPSDEIKPVRIDLRKK